MLADRLQQRQQQSVQGLRNLRAVLAMPLQGIKLQVKVMRSIQIPVLRRRVALPSEAAAPPSPDFAQSHPPSACSTATYSNISSAPSSASSLSSPPSAPPLTSPGTTAVSPSTTGAGPAAPTASSSLLPLPRRPTTGGDTLSGASGNSNHGGEGYAAEEDGPVEPMMEERVTEALLICKWGGVLTHAGVHQAHNIGELFRSSMLPKWDKGERNAFLSDVRVFSNNERRVQRSAAAFTETSKAQGKARGAVLAGVGGAASLFDVPELPDGFIIRDHELLNDTPAAAHALLDDMKRRLSKVLLQDRDLSPNGPGVHLDPSDELDRDTAVLLDKGLGEIGKPLTALKQVYSTLQRWIMELETQPERATCENETLGLLRQRWAKVAADLYNPKTATWDTSKIPDLWDGVNYDCIHHREYISPAPGKKQSTLDELRDRTKPFADLVGGQEFGITRAEKIRIGGLVAGPLLGQVLDDIERAAFSPGRSVSLYFTSEAHLHSVLNVLLLSDLKCIVDRDDISEMDYMSHFIFKVYENSRSQFRIELYFSTGAVYGPQMELGPSHAVPIDPSMLLHESLTLQQLHQLIDPIRATPPPSAPTFAPGATPGTTTPALPPAPPTPPASGPSSSSSVSATTVPGAGTGPPSAATPPPSKPL